MRTTVYKKNLGASYSLKLKNSRRFFRDISEKYSTMPFSIASLKDPTAARAGLPECVNHDLLQSYPVLTEKPGEFVAQFKTTVVLLPSGTLVFELPPFDEDLYDTSFKIEDKHILELFSQPLDRKKAKKGALSNIKSQIELLKNLSKPIFDPIIIDIKKMASKDNSFFLSSKTLLKTIRESLTMFRSAINTYASKEKILEYSMNHPLLKAAFAKRKEIKQLIRSRLDSLIKRNELCEKLILSAEKYFESIIEHHDPSTLKIPSFCDPKINSFFEALKICVKLAETISKTLPDFLGNLNLTIKKHEDIFNDLLKQLNQRINEHKRKEEISKELGEVLVKTKDCIKRIELTELKLEDESSLFDTTKIAKIANEDPNTWLTESEKKLNKSLENTPSIPKKWGTKMVGAPMKMLEESKEFSLHLIKNAFDSIKMKPIFTNSHVTSTLNIHNVHLLSSSYNNAEKIKIRIKDPASDSGDSIFKNEERKLAFIEKSREDIANKLGITKEEIKIIDLKKCCIELAFIVEINTNLRSELKKITETFSADGNDKDVSVGLIKEKMKDLYKGNLLNIEAESILSTFVFDVNYLNPVFDLDYTSGMQSEDTRGGWAYYLPIGFKRLAIQVKGVYEDDIWIDRMDETGWAVAFHGLTYDPMNAMQNIIKQGNEEKKGFNLSRPGRSAYGVGVYCAPDYHIAEGYARCSPVSLMTTQGSLNYILIFQCRVNADKKVGGRVVKEENVHIAEGVDGSGKYCKDYWVVKDPKNIRPYGILIKQL